MRRDGHNPCMSHLPQEASELDRAVAKAHGGRRGVSMERFENGSVPHVDCLTRSKSRSVYGGGNSSNAS